MRHLHPPVRAVLRLLAALLLLTGTACDSSTDPPSAAQLELTGVPAQAPVGETFQLTVRVLDGAGRPFGSAAVSLSGQGGVTVTPAQVTTGADGRATASATLPQAPGTGGVTAQLQALTASASVTVQVGAPAALHKIGGDAQQGPVRGALPTPVAVRVVDEFDNPVPGATVTFEGVGGAVPSAASIATNAEGVAGVSITLGPDVGAQGAIARHSSAGAVTFALTGVPRFASIRVSPAAHAFTEIGQTVRLTAQALNAQEQPVAGIDFAWASSAAAVASVASDGTVTAHADGTAAITATADGITSAAAGIVVQSAVRLSRGDAVAAARAAVVDAAAAGCFILALAPQQMLQAGTVIRDGIDDEGTSITVAAPSWFVFVDLVPSHRWLHPVRYVLVDAETGTVTSVDAAGPPRVGGQLLYLDFEERLLSPDRIEPVSLADGPRDECVAPAAPSLRLGGPTAASVRSFDDLERSLRARVQDGGNIVAVVVNGGHPSSGAKQEGMGESFDADAADMTDFLESIGADITQYSYRQHQLLDIINGIRERLQSLGPDDKFVLYFVGHGGPRGLYYGSGTANAGVWDITSTDNDFGLLGLLGDVPAGTVNVALDVCYAGSASQWMTAPMSGAPFTPGLPTGEVNIFAGASSTLSGSALRRDIRVDQIKNHPDFDPYRNDPGFDEWFDTKYKVWISQQGTYTQHFLERVRARNLDTDGDGTVSIAELEAGWIAEQGTLTDAIKQKPPAATTFRGPGEVRVIAEDITFNHVVQQSPCPQQIGSIRLVNATDRSAIWSITSTNPNLTFTTTSGSFGPNREFLVGVAFNCYQAQSFQADVTITIRAGDLTETKTIRITGNISG